MKMNRLSQVVGWGSSLALSFTLVACGTPNPGSSSSSQNSTSQSSSVSSSSSSSSYESPNGDFAVNGDVESGTTNWAARGAATITRDTTQKHSGSASLLVADRGDFWQGATFDVGDLTPGNTYDVAVWVRLAEGEPSETLKLTGKIVDDADSETYLEYTEIATATISSSEWTLLSGTYVPDGQFESFILESFEGSVNVSFYADDFAIVGEVDPNNTGSSSSSSSASNSSSSQGNVSGVPLNPNRKGLSALANIPIGVAVNLEGGSRDTFNSSARTAIVLDNFSQVSVENNMKMSYWGSNYSNSKVDSRLIPWARDNNFTIHGHTLVWHPCYQLPSWAESTSGYQESLINHVKGVASQYTDVIRSWDVVNEALFDSNDESSYGSCRYEAGGDTVNGVKYRKSAHYLGMGAEYIATAFIEADKVTDADLYYNDFNIENGQDKTTWLVNLVKNLKDSGVPIDGVGFQMHVLPDWPSISSITASWKKIVDLGLKVKITELDVRINNQYDGDTSNDYTSCGQGCAGRDNQKARYKDIIKAYYQTVPAAQRGGITIWGISDPDSWYASDPDWPLLWDDSLSEKPAFYGVEEALSESN